jgi:hypothetical protein
LLQITSEVLGHNLHENATNPIKPIKKIKDMGASYYRASRALFSSQLVGA